MKIFHMNQLLDDSHEISSFIFSEKKKKKKKMLSAAVVVSALWVSAKIIIKLLCTSFI